MSGKTNTGTRVSQLWDLIETWGFRFREDIKDIIVDGAGANNNEDNNNNNDDKDNIDSNNDKGISALGLDQDMGFLRGHQGYRHRQQQ